MSQITHLVLLYDQASEPEIYCINSPHHSELTEKQILDNSSIKLHFGPEDYLEIIKIESKDVINVPK